MRALTNLQPHLSPYWSRSIGRLAAHVTQEKPLVSTDYTDDPRSSIIDAACTQVIDGTMVKVYAWYVETPLHILSRLRSASATRPAR